MYVCMHACMFVGSPRFLPVFWIQSESEAKQCPERGAGFVQGTVCGASGIAYIVIQCNITECNLL